MGGEDRLPRYSPSNAPTCSGDHQDVHGNSHGPRKLIHKRLSDRESSVVSERLSDRFAHRSSVDVTIDGPLENQSIVYLVVNKCQLKLKRRCVHKFSLENSKPSRASGSNQNDTK